MQLTTNSSLFWKKFLISIFYPWSWWQQRVILPSQITNRSPRLMSCLVVWSPCNFLFICLKKTYKRSNDTKCISMQIMGKPRGSNSSRWNNLQKFVRSSWQNWQCSLYWSNKMHASMKGKNEGKSLCTHWFVGAWRWGVRTRRECIKSLLKWLPIHYWFVDVHDWICEWDSVVWKRN